MISIALKKRQFEHMRALGNTTELEVFKMMRGNRSTGCVLIFKDRYAYLHVCMYISN